MSSGLLADVEEENSLKQKTKNLLLGGDRRDGKSSRMRDEPISLTQRMISACSGSLITSLVVTPFDVIRIRMQQQEILNTCCNQDMDKVYQMSKQPGQRNTLGAVGETTPELFWVDREYCKSSGSCSRITSTYQGFSVVSKNEGLATLWRGLSLTLFMTIPSNIIYFTGYEYIRDNSPIISHPTNPLICGAIARMMAATFVSPIELIKTRLQSVPTDKQSSSKILSNILKDSVTLLKEKGVRTLFTGLQITLWRDVPFSAIYWSNYEFFKHRLSKQFHANFDSKASTGNDWRVFSTSFLAGSISGSVAALFTHPFDVGKTRLQIISQDSGNGLRTKGPSMFSFLVGIYKREGYRAMLSGLGPRIMKIAPSCAIMISSYEVGKKFFKNVNSI